MEKTDFELESLECSLYEEKEAKYVLVQASDIHDKECMDEEAALLAESGEKVALFVFYVNDWNSDLSPWQAPPVFGKAPFSGKAEETLVFLEKTAVPFLKEKYPGAKYIIGGYSLAGLFSLWAGYKTDVFDGIAAASPSVWFPGWIDFSEKEKANFTAAYLSLGDKESKTRNETMKKVGDCIEKLEEIFVDREIDTVLEWNLGNHFVDAEKRTVRAFSWVMETLGRR